MLAGGVVLVTLVVAGSADASAGTGHVRYSHNEPLNDLRLTPGATFDVTRSTVCHSGYATRARHVTVAEKNAVYAEYGITHRVAYQYEIDHLIPLELGGNNSMANLWPQSNDHPRGYLNSKDRLENVLHALVCNLRLGLRAAQSEIATDWVATYHRYLGTWPPGVSVAALPTTSLAPLPTESSRPSRTTITSVYRVVAPGQREVLSVLSPFPHGTCTLDVTLPSGRHSTASGLGSTSTNARGAATWTWWIGSRTGAGTAHVTVTCGASVAQGTFVVS